MVAIHLLWYRVAIHLPDTHCNVIFFSGLLSFMMETTPTLGSIETSDYEKRTFAFK